MTPSGARFSFLPASARDRITLLVTAIVNVALLIYFHNRYWYPTDDGFYAHLAERLLNGEVLARDVQDIHPGLIHLVNVMAMRLFGVEMVAMRYPLVLASFAQSLMVMALLRRKGVLIAAAASIATTSLGTLQFFDPTPNWYCLALAIALAGWLTTSPQHRAGALLATGLILGTLTMFRQLSGIWAAMAVVTLTLFETARRQGTGGAVVSRAILAIMLVALLWYVIVSPETEPGGLILMAIWPAALLIFAISRVRASDAAAVRALGWILAGALCAAAPMLIYHAAHGSSAALFRDTVLAGFYETQMPFFGQGWYGLLPIAALYQTLSSFDAVKIANGLYWIALPLLSLANGVMLLHRLRREPFEMATFALPIVAAFYALVSLYLEGPLYLYYSAALSLLGVVWQIGKPARSRPVAAGLLFIAVVAVTCHAAQPRTRTSIEILEGRRTAQFSAPVASLERVGLRIGAEDEMRYARIVKVVRAASSDTDPIFALPNDAEIYFLARRRNPFRFYNSALGVLTEADGEAVIDVIEHAPPALVLFRPQDKYNNIFSSRIMTAVRRTYTQIAVIDGLEVYKHDLQAATSPQSTVHE